MEGEFWRQATGNSKICSQFKKSLHAKIKAHTNVQSPWATGEIRNKEYPVFQIVEGTHLHTQKNQLALRKENTLPLKWEKTWLGGAQRCKEVRKFAKTCTRKFQRVCMILEKEARVCRETDSTHGSSHLNGDPFSFDGRGCPFSEKRCQSKSTFMVLNEPIPTASKIWRVHSHMQGKIEHVINRERPRNLKLRIHALDKKVHSREGFQKRGMCPTWFV